MNLEKVKMYLLDKGILDECSYKNFLNQKEEFEYFEETLYRLNILDKNEYLELLSYVYNYKTLDITDYEVLFELNKYYSKDYLLMHRFIVLELNETTVKVVTSRPQNILLVEDLKEKFKKNVDLFISDFNSISLLIEQVYEKLDLLSNFTEESSRFDMLDDFSLSDNSPLIKLVNDLISQASSRGASDIHIDPIENEILIKYRIDGLLETSLSLPKKVHSKIINRIKVMSKLDLSETRLPQDGRMKIFIKEEEIDLRVAIIPTINGEKAVLRFLYMKKSKEELSNLGYTSDQIDLIKRKLNSKNGIILLSGPTGSGKSTSLYAMLNILLKKNINILTVEDPVEMRIDGINQIQVREELGLTFSSSLRSILRLDPDVIMIGEMRDTLTAKIAFRASLTGHLVLSTIHTSSAIEIISRLMDMDVETYLFSNALTLIVAQRLVRKVCNKCARKRPITFIEKEMFKKYKINIEELLEPVGCDYCNSTGYKGRIALFEMIDVNKVIVDKILISNNQEEIQNYLRSIGYKFLIDAGLEKVKEGITTIDELSVHVMDLSL